MVWHTPLHLRLLHLPRGVIWRKRAATAARRKQPGSLRLKRRTRVRSYFAHAAAVLPLFLSAAGELCVRGRAKLPAKRRSVSDARVQLWLLQMFPATTSGRVRRMFRGPSTPILAEKARQRTASGNVIEPSSPNVTNASPPWADVPKHSSQFDVIHGLRHLLRRLVARPA